MFGFINGMCYSETVMQVIHFFVIPSKTMLLILSPKNPAAAAAGRWNIWIPGGKVFLFLQEAVGKIRRWKSRG